MLATIFFDCKREYTKEEAYTTIWAWRLLIEQIPHVYLSSSDIAVCQPIFQEEKKKLGVLTDHEFSCTRLKNTHSINSKLTEPDPKGMWRRRGTWPFIFCMCFICQYFFALLLCYTSKYISIHCVAFPILIFSRNWTCQYLSLWFVIRWNGRARHLCKKCNLLNVLCVRSKIVKKSWWIDTILKSSSSFWFFLSRRINFRWRWVFFGKCAFVCR